MYIPRPPIPAVAEAAAKLQKKKSSYGEEDP